MTDTASSPSLVFIARPAAGGADRLPAGVSVGLMWSFGGTIARFISVDDSWTVVFWRSVWAAAFLLCFMVWRDGWRGHAEIVPRHGPSGLAVGFCFATASTAFVVALAYTTVANIR